MKMRSLLRGLAVPALCLLAPLAHADFIACPAEARWEVTTPLPDPWSATVQVSRESQRFTVYINAVEWLVCRYSHEPGALSVFPNVGSNFELRLQRPPIHGVAVSEVNCPAQSITTEVTSPTPAPWKSTKYIWKVAGVAHVNHIGGQETISCRYAAPMDSQGVGPSSLLQPLNLGDDKPLAATPKPGPKLPGNLAVEFAVMNASLATVPAPQQRACPAQVGFQGSIEVNGPGEVIYRTVDNKGTKGPQKKLVFDKAGAKPVALQINVGTSVPPPSAGAGSLSATPTPAGPQLAAAGGGATGPAAGSNLSGATSPGKLWGFMRIEILAPTGGKTKSQDAAWSVQCVTVNQQPAGSKMQVPRNVPPNTSPTPNLRRVVPPKDTDKDKDKERR